MPLGQLGRGDEDGVADLLRVGPQRIADQPDEEVVVLLLHQARGGVRVVVADRAGLAQQGGETPAPRRCAGRRRRTAPRPGRGGRSRCWTRRRGVVLAQGPLLEQQPPRSSKRKTEKARCRRPGAWWAESFSAVPMVLPSSSTSSSRMTASGESSDERLTAVAGVIGIPILRFGPERPSLPHKSGALGTCRAQRARIGRYPSASWRPVRGPYPPVRSGRGAVREGVARRGPCPPARRRRRMAPAHPGPVRAPRRPAGRPVTIL